MTSFPEGRFLITDAMKQWTADNEFDYLDLRSETAMFKDNALAKGLEYRDWGRAWQTWIRRASGFNPRPLDRTQTVNRPEVSYDPDAPDMFAEYRFGVTRDGRGFA